MFLDGVSYISSAVKKIGQLVCQLICTSCGVPLLVVHVLLCFQGVDVFINVQIFTQCASVMHIQLMCVCIRKPLQVRFLEAQIRAPNKMIRSSICLESACSFSQSGSGDNVFGKILCQKEKFLIDCFFSTWIYFKATV